MATIDERHRKRCEELADYLAWEIRDFRDSLADLDNATAAEIMLPVMRAAGGGYWARPCACGCGRILTSPRRNARYATAACRVKACRARKGS